MRLHPRRQLNEYLQRLDDLQNTLSRCAKRGMNERLVTWKNLSSRLRQARPKQLLKQRRELLKVSQRRFARIGTDAIQELQNFIGSCGIAFAFARAGTGFIARLFHYDGREDGKNHPPVKGSKKRPAFENAREGRRNFQPRGKLSSQGATITR